MIKLGKGGVDDAEDAEVILHELGHAIQDSQQTPFGFGLSVEAGSIGEGFADYWAATVSNLKAPTPDPACIADWDSVSYDPTAPHCLRRVDTNLHYPKDLNGAVHHDGQIWSRALWDIRNALGNVRADTLILEGQFGSARSEHAAARTEHHRGRAESLRKRGGEHGSRCVRRARNPPAVTPGEGRPRAPFSTNRGSLEALPGRVTPSRDPTSRPRARGRPGPGSSRRCSASSPRRSPWPLKAGQRT